MTVIIIFIFSSEKKRNMESVDKRHFSSSYVSEDELLCVKTFVSDYYDIAASNVEALSCLCDHWTAVQGTQT